MHPILFQFGDAAVHTYGALGGLSFLIGAAVVIARARAIGVPAERSADLIFLLALTSLAGARLTFVVQNPGVVTSFAELFDLRGGGLVFYGAFLVGFPVGFLWMRRAGLPAFALWDILATAFPLSHALSRVGCFAAGCCYGRPSDGPLAVQFPPGGLAPSHAPLHPVQLYEAAALAGIAAIVAAAYPRRRYDGQVMALYLLLYAAARPALEAFRGDVERGWFLPAWFGERMSWSQGVSGVLAVFALVVFVGAARGGSTRTNTV